MPFYMITFGLTQIDELYIGRTNEETVASARGLIDQWPEYAAMSDEEIIELAKADELEFDLIEIHDTWPGENLDHQQLVDIYESQQGG
ncbi:hypothetical protein FQ192_31235 [Pseudomonas sp. ANT_J12]|uniref:Uncharacterized protein n=1 Tax=Pseudomonas prosekii TaxID=1148509 RepID=A0A2U2D6T3_9PSED|nr:MULTISPECIES: hypothetical protein [Pseudomonas]KAA0982673.1 hypothetical protein FQ192_31235 [Pseudomonas sp. ANT_J12]PWE43674.1 hypothetical protein C9I49_15320 [Pseudomonas prosekii]